MREHLDYPDIPYHELLSRAAERWGSRTAIVSGGARITFGEWNDEADRCAAALAAWGLRKGDRVALFTPNCPEYEVALFGIARAGGVATALNPSYRDREVHHQLADSGARAAFVHAALLPMLEAARESGLPDLQLVVTIGGGDERSPSFESFLDSAPGPAPRVPLGPDDLVALPYSSGTTGLAKGVMLTQRNLVANAYQWLEATASTERDALLIFLPLYHIYGVGLVSTAVISGARQVLMQRFDLVAVLRMIREERVTELFVVPPVMLALAHSPDISPDALRDVRFVMSAAAPLSPDVARRVSERFGVPVIQAYGMTETSPLTHMVPRDRAMELLGTTGVVVADTECRIVDIETGERELTAGEVGEVTVRGPQVMAGYWKAPAETLATLREGWIYTGDIGMVDEAGNLQIVDRKKEMIKYKAFSIAPAELETVLLEHPSVIDCGVTGQPDTEAGEVPRAYVVLRPGEDVAPEELQAFVRERVAGYKQIRAIEIVDAIPRTPSGKILRRVLRERARGLEAR